MGAAAFCFSCFPVFLFSCFRAEPRGLALLERFKLPSDLKAGVILGRSGRAQRALWFSLFDLFSLFSLLRLRKESGKALGSQHECLAS